MHARRHNVAKACGAAVSAPSQAKLDRRFARSQREVCPSTSVALLTVQEIVIIRQLRSKTLDMPRCFLHSRPRPRYLTEREIERLMDCAHGALLCQPMRP